MTLCLVLRASDAYHTSMGILGLGRLVIKLGSHVVIDDKGQLARGRLRQLVQQMAELHNQGSQILLVSSGAVALGKLELGLKKTLTLEDKQACAATGQAHLMHEYHRLFAREGIKVAQVLVSSQDFANKQSFINLSKTLQRLLELRVLPILNENDSVATAELESQKSFSDNDKLSALLAIKAGAQTLVLLGQGEGLYWSDPKQKISKHSERQQTQDGPIRFINQIDDLKKITGSSRSSLGRGGLNSKLEVARMAALSGVHVVFASGYKPKVLHDIFSAQETEQVPGTLLQFKLSALRTRSLKKNWIAFSSPFRGTVVINQGAVRALVVQGASLLAGGVVELRGSFTKGDVLQVLNEQGVEVARGQAQCGYEEAHERVMSAQQKIKVPVLIHRDHLALLVDQESVVV